MVRKNIELTDEQVNNLLQQFYEYFETGFEFEKFLKVYLEKMGLDEVRVTKKTRDGGIDLEAVKNGLFSKSDVDILRYYIQAKRNKVDTTISPAKVRELKGKIPFGHKGLFITTARFSANAQLEAESDPSKPVILVDGKTLLESCIDKEIGFVFNPVFSKSAMDSLREEIVADSIMNSENQSEIVIDKVITANDIRARILRLPKTIMELIEPSIKRVRVKFNSMEEKELNIDKSRCYLAGVTELYKDSGLIAEDGSYKPCKAIWKYSEEKIEIVIKER